MPTRLYLNISFSRLRSGENRVRRVGAVYGALFLLNKNILKNTDHTYLYFTT